MVATSTTSTAPHRVRRPVGKLRLPTGARFGIGLYATLGNVMQALPPRVNILGVAVTAQTMGDAVAAIGRWIEQRASAYVCVTTAHVLVESQRHPSLKATLNAADMVTTDGMPLVWLCRSAGHAAERVYGPDLMLELCARSGSEGWRHFLYGGTDQSLERLRARLTARFPGLCIVGSDAPPFRPLTDLEDTAAVERINAAVPDILWVGLGGGKQDLWIAEHRGRIAAPVMIGVGAAFDFLAGSKRQAPRWMQHNGLEWLFRLAMEPRRLWRRYLLGNALFLWYVALQHLGLRAFPVDPAAPRAQPQ